jgi:hypothetical protein
VRDARTGHQTRRSQSDALRDVTRTCTAAAALCHRNTGIGMRAWFNAAESWGTGDVLVDVGLGGNGPRPKAAPAHTAG